MARLLAKLPAWLCLLTLGCPGAVGKNPAAAPEPPVADAPLRTDPQASVAPREDPDGLGSNFDGSRDEALTAMLDEAMLVVRRDGEALVIAKARQLLLPHGAAPPAEERVEVGETFHFVESSHFNAEYRVVALEQQAAQVEVTYNGKTQERTVPLRYSYDWELAAFVGDHAQLQVLLAGKVNRRGRHGRTALMIAAHRRDLPTTKFLLDQGADPAAHDDRAVFPIFGDTANADFVRAYLKHPDAEAAPPIWVVAQAVGPRYACESSPESLSLLMDTGLTDDKYWIKGTLNAAIRCHNLAAIKFLLEHGARPGSLGHSYPFSRFGAERRQETLDLLEEYGFSWEP